QRGGMPARHALVWGLLALLVVALWLYPQPWLPLLALPLILMAAFLVRGADLVSTISLLLYAAWLDVNASREYPLVSLLFGLVLCIGVSRLATNTVYSALRWAWSAQQQADQLLDEARARQAELASALKSLELATYQLEMANQKLYVARRQTLQAQRTKEQ